jgi:ABC-type transporter Mla subunit MlaD
VIPVLFLLGVLVLAVFLGLWLRGRSRRRQRTLTRIMDDADAMESLLRRTRERMDAMQTVVGRMPPDIAAEARASLDSHERLQAGFRDLLQHRMWLQQNVATASQHELDEAARALERAKARITAELDRLDNAGAALESATTSALVAAIREPPALRRGSQ